MLIRFEPGNKGMLPLDEPLKTVIPLTIIVAVLSTEVGVIAADVIELLTVAVYDVVALKKLGLNVKPVNADRYEEDARVTVITYVNVPANILITLDDPTAKLILPLATPLDTTIPLTYIVLVLVGVTVILDVSFVTFKV